MASGISLHVGVNRVDPSHYDGFDRAGGGQWTGGLNACEHDAIDLESLTAAEGFAASTLLSEAATTDSVGSAISEAADALGPGDMFVLTFSGYGGQVRDSNSDEHWSEKTWALYDRQLPEDELASLLGSFRPEVRVLVIEDSSSVGTVRRSLPTFFDDESEAGGPVTRELPPDIAQLTYRTNSGVYDEIQRALPSWSDAVIPAAVTTIAGFRDGQLGAEGPENGLFTGMLVRVWDAGRFEGTYTSFVRDIETLMPPTQTPELETRGASPAFVRERPFTIEPG